MKLISTLLISLLLSFSVFGKKKTIKPQNKTKKIRKIRSAKKTKRKMRRKLKRKYKKRAQRNKIEANLAYQHENLKEANNSAQTLSGDGVNLNINRIFYITKNLTANTGIVGNLLLYKVTSPLGLSTDNARLYDGGLIQNIGYSFNISSFTIRPFIDVFYTFGTASIDVRNPSQFQQNANHNNDTNYRRYGGSLGLQMKLKNNVAPFVKYRISKLELSDSQQVQNNFYNGTYFPTTNAHSSINRSGNQSDSNAIILGLGFSF